MKSHAMIYGVLLQILLISILWLTALAPSVASVTAPDISADETTTFSLAVDGKGSDADTVNTAGTYTVTLNVTDNEKAMGMDTVTVAATDIDAQSSIWRPFSDDSPWNTSIGDYPITDLNSNAYINYINQYYHEVGGSGDECHVGCAIYSWAIPVYFVEDLDPYPDVINVPAHSSWGHDLSAPIPSFAQPDPSADAHLCIIDRNTGEEWDFWQVRGTYPNFTSGTGRTISVFDSGVRPPYEHGCRGAGFPLIAGLIRPEEIQAGEIRHALVFAHDARGPWGQFVFPASTGQDGGNTSEDILPFGARIQLKPEVDISGFPRGAQIVATAMKTYGMYLGDRNDYLSIGVYFQTDGQPESWEGIFEDEDRWAISGLKASDFRVIELPPIGGDRPPRITITTPTEGSLVSGMITVQATAADEDGTVSSTEFYLDDEATPRHTDTNSPYTWNLDTTTLSLGSHVIRAVAEDNEGAHGWHAVTVIVDLERTSTSTPTPTATNTPTLTSTPTPTATSTPLPTNTPTATNTPLLSTYTPTPTSTVTPTPAPTNTPTATSTALPTNTPTATDTPLLSTYTPTPTSTATPTPTATNTPTLTNTPTPTVTDRPPLPTSTPTRKTVHIFLPLINKGWDQGD